MASSLGFAAPSPDAHPQERLATLEQVSSDPRFPARDSVAYADVARCRPINAHCCPLSSIGSTFSEFARTQDPVPQPLRPQTPCRRRRTADRLLRRRQLHSQSRHHRQTRWRTVVRSRRFRLAVSNARRRKRRINCRMRVGRHKRRRRRISHNLRRIHRSTTSVMPRRLRVRRHRLQSVRQAQRLRGSRTLDRARQTRRGLPRPECRHSGAHRRVSQNTSSVSAATPPSH